LELDQHRIALRLDVLSICLFAFFFCLVISISII
jgi:hypothetical protein